MNQIQSLEIDNESLTRLIHQTERSQQKTVDFRNETEQCQLESETWTKKYDLLKSDLHECSLNRHDYLQSVGHIGISVIRHVKNARETDSCLGTITSSGYITSSSCCQADQIFLFEIENSTEITNNLENSIWIEDHICFINTTDIFKFHFPISDDAETQSCTFLAFDDSQGEFQEHQIEIETQDCVDSTCTWHNDPLDNAMILEGTSIVCNGSPKFGIITKSKSL